LERPRDPSHGDWSTNGALVLAKRLDTAPRELAARVSEELDLAQGGIAGASVAGPGFLNFRLDDSVLWEGIQSVLDQGSDWGRSPDPSGRRVNVEFVSANPTGPLHIAHGRGAAIGDAVASLLEWAGDEVTREFYVNDAGRQIDLLAESVEARFAELGGGSAEVPADGYHGQYILDVARSIADAEGAGELASLDPAARRLRFRDEAVKRLQQDQADDLAAFGVRMQTWSSEREVLESGAVDQLLARLAGRDLTYSRDGALWLRTSRFGDEKDRVLIKADGAHTYFLPDLAYHLEKAERGFNLAIDVWGADHHGHEHRMQAALAGLGYPDLLEVLILQLVTVTRDGKEAKMSKRTGKFVRLRDLVAETGPSVARYFFLMRRSEVHLNFDLDLALDTSDANPVYKIQYAHARMCRVLERAAEAQPWRAAGALPLDTPDPDAFSELNRPEERGVAFAALRLPGVVRRAAQIRAPHILCTYLETLAGAANSWYQAGRPDPSARILTYGRGRRGRLKLARAVQTTLRNGLMVLGIDAPERMEREQDL